ncbi:MAG: hypothetical protein CBC55_04755 [Gammaproteobacteria bacterium TMED95]|nr:MAG: hypothetical protein CBC55_04755 [Gammaproteobacteria bacterium TMED95]|tara:strand:+ start:6454 stop:6927 length:474 start_codon:yes stop_codon:yes gene_type:complete
MAKRELTMKFISRLGNGWTVRVAIPYTHGEEYIYSRFLDKDFGGAKDASLRAAQKQRDHDAKLVGADKYLVRQKRTDAKSTLITGLSEVRTEELGENGTVYEKTYIVAHHPLKCRAVARKFMYKDNPTRKNSRTRTEAIKLAEKARRQWEKEAAINR